MLDGPVLNTPGPSLEARRYLTFSMVQLAVQPSPLVTLPSSQVSLPATWLSPQLLPTPRVLWRDAKGGNGRTYISATEDLKGVFIVPCCGLGCQFAAPIAARAKERSAAFLLFRARSGIAERRLPPERDAIE
jgi:hypothetical protein